MWCTPSLTYALTSLLLTQVVYTESPANPTCRLTDLAAVGALVTEWAERTGNKKPWVMCDATFATPFHQRSLEIPGVDVAIHSATKYATHPSPPPHTPLHHARCSPLSVPGPHRPLLLPPCHATPPYRAPRLTRYIGGHSDILAGAVTVKHNELTHEVAKVQKLIGAPLAPLESFLLARGLRTLHVRMERHGENAMVAAKMLETHPLIETLYYPGLPSHPDHELAKRVFTSGGPNSNAREQTFGGMLAFIVKGDPDTALRRAQRFAERLELVTLAVSLGGAAYIYICCVASNHPHPNSSPSASPNTSPSASLHTSPHTSPNSGSNATLAPSLGRSLARVPSRCKHSLTHSRTHSLTHSLAHARTHSRTHSLTNTLANSPTNSPTHPRTH